MTAVLKLIEERQSVRALYDSRRPVAKEDLRKILEAGRWAPTPHNVQNFEILIVDDKELLESLGNIRYPITDRFIEENCQNLSLSEEELLRKKVGLLGRRGMKTLPALSASSFEVTSSGREISGAIGTSPATYEISALARFLFGFFEVFRPCCFIYPVKGFLKIFFS
jgi:nitroreductase